jgi:hypothetical protein
MQVTDHWRLFRPQASAEILAMTDKKIFYGFIGIDPAHIFLTIRDDSIK